MKFREGDRRKIKAALDMTPLIDVVFQLLVFFMLSATFVVQSSIPIEMPEAAAAAKLEQKDLSITITNEEGGPDDGGKIYVNQLEILNYEELTQTLVEFRATQQSPLVLIRPDKNISSGQLIKVMGIAHSVGLDKIQVGAQAPDLGQ